MEITHFFDPETFTFTYIVSDPDTSHCAIIDPVLNFDPVSGRISTRSADALIEYVQQNNLVVDYLLETHVHADHLSAASHLKKTVGGKTGIGRYVTKVQQIFGEMFNAGESFYANGSQFDCLFAEGDELEVGNLKLRVMLTPGHTEACATYLVEDAAFVGDTLFMPDYGTARTDFPGGDAGTLYDSIQRILSLPDDTRLHMCHDYLTAERTEYQHVTTVAEEKNNVHLAGKDRAAYIEDRECRDAKLNAPRLLLPSIQVNMRGGDLPPAEDNNVSYLKIPLRLPA